MRCFQRFTAYIAFSVVCVPGVLATPVQGQQSNLSASAQDQGVWAATYRQAQRLATERRRLVLIHFWNDNCPPCRSVERNVFSLPEVERALSVNYVPVRVNVSDEPELARQFSINRWPTDVVVTAEGLEVYRTTSEQDPNRYIAFLDRVAAHARVGMAAPRDSSPPGPTNETNTIGSSSRDEQGFTPRNYDDRVLANRNAPQNDQLGYQPRDAQQYVAASPAGNRPLENNTFVPNNDSRFGGAPDMDRRTSPQRPWQGSANDQVPPADNRGFAGNSTYQPQGQANTASPVGANENFTPRQDTFVANNAFSSNPAPPSGQDPSRRIDPNSAPSMGVDPRVQNTTWNGQANSQTGFVPNNQAPAHAGFDPQRNAPPLGGTAQGAAYNSGAPQQPAKATPTNTGFALDGYCPVTLTEQRKWKKADPAFGAIHRDRTYIFASAEDQQKFLSNPDKYSPMLSGYDPVVFAEQRQLVVGKRQHGLTFGDQMYLFTDEASLQQFWKQPQAYVRVAQEAMRTSPTPNMQR